MPSNKCYDDIIHLPHPVSTKHPPMSLEDRAAQFAPFAALTGHDAAIKETARIRDEKELLSDETIALLNEKLQIISENLGLDQSVEIRYFVPDKTPSQGSYITHCGIVHKIDRYGHQIIMTDGTCIPMGQISSIEGECFRDWER